MDDVPLPSGSESTMTEHIFVKIFVDWKEVVMHKLHHIRNDRAFHFPNAHVKR